MKKSSKSLIVFAPGKKEIVHKAFKNIHNVLPFDGNVFEFLED